MAWGGATASQWVVVVNADSATSRTVANHFCELRQIPSRNVIFLRDVPNRETATVDEFREKILSPLLKEIEARGLSPHLQGIAYSADFPTAIDFLPDTLELKSRSPYLIPTGSINSLTYLYRLCLAKSPSMLSMEANLYACREGKWILEKGIPASKQADWDQWVQLLSDGNKEEAKKGLQALLQAYPNNFAMSYLAAQQWAKQGELDVALELLELSIGQGWCYGEMLKTDEALATLRDSSKFQLLRDSCPTVSFDYQRGRGFDARTYWSPSGIGMPTDQDGMAYLLSTVLAVTRGDGNSIDEVVSYLRKSKEADFSQPEGKFFFTKTDDVRTTTRVPMFELACNRLRELGHQAEVVTDRMPMFEKSVLGVTMGAASFQWRASASQFQPGAIAENLTSLGGAMASQGDQTKLTEYLRYGAAGSSGAVTEPYTIPFKFPHPMIHAHYAEGATLAEAFYLSVNGPYQLLIVGDPLCQPFAIPPKVQVAGLTAGQTIGRKVALQIGTRGLDAESLPVRIDLVLDGKWMRTLPFAPRLQFDLAQDIEDGFHELRLLFTDATHMQHKWEETIPFVVGKQEAIRVEKTIDTKLKKRKLRMKCQGPQGWTLSLRHHWNEVAQSEKSTADFEIDLDAFGKGPVRFQVVAMQNERMLYSKPWTVDLDTMLIK